jgi:hypothetical protein
MKKFPVHSRAGRVRIACAASLMMSGVRERCIPSPNRFRTAAVAMRVRGHSEFTATPSAANSYENPSVVRLIPYLAVDVKSNETGAF